MNVFLNILLLTVIVVYLTDFAKWWRLPTGLIRWFVFRRFEGFEMKPLSCSFCMTFWAGVIYLAVTHNMTIPTMATVCVCSICTRAVSAILDLICEGTIKIINKIL